MKKYILFCFITFQVAVYSQNTTIPNPDFEKKPIPSEIDNCKPNEKTQLNDSTCNINNLSILKDSAKLTFNATDAYQTQQKNLDISKRIKRDYLVFNYNQLTVADAGNDLINYCRDRCKYIRMAPCSAYWA